MIFFIISALLATVVILIAFEELLCKFGLPYLSVNKYYKYAKYIMVIVFITFILGLITLLV